VGDEKISIYMIDGFGSSEVLPFSQWLESIGRKKVVRKLVRFSTRYDFHLFQKEGE